MIITPAALTALMTGFRKEYQDGLSMVEPSWSKIATLVPSTTKSNTYGWLGQFPKFREWVGARVIKDMEAHSYAITNKDYESTIGVKRTDIEDDNIGIYAPLFREMGRAAAVHPDELIWPLLLAGFATACYDGQYFFDTDHPVNAEVDGSGADASVSNIQAGAQAGNPWFLLDTTRAIKPLIYQQRKKPVFTHMTKSDDEEVFMNNEYRFGVDSRENVGFGFWQMAYASKETLDAAAFNANYAAMMAFKGDGGRPLGVTPNLLVCGPSNREAALEVVKAERNAAGATNINRNAVDVLVSPYIP